MKESIESPRSSSLFPDRSRSGMRYFPYSGVWEASYVLKYVTRARKRAVYKIDRHVRNVKVQGSRRRGVVHGLIDKPLSFRSYRTYVVRIRSFPPPSSSQWTAIAITNATFFPSLLSPSPFFS